MEGTLDLVQAFGYVPTNLYLCAAAYQYRRRRCAGRAMSRR